MKNSPSRFEIFLKIFDNILLNLPPKTHYCKLHYILNFHKGATIFIMFFFMLYFKNYNRGPILYMGLHGVYGLLWLVKYYAFPDATFDQKVSLGSSIIVTVVLMFYWGFGFLLFGGYGIQRPSGLRMACAIITFMFGLTLVLCADAQKYYTLRLKKGLISDGLFARTRNPNYLGEALVYSGLAICTGLWFSWVVLVSVWMSLFLYRIFLKEFSLMKKEGYEEYKERSGILFPKIFRNNFVDWTFYGAVIGIGLYVYYNRAVITIKMISQYHY